MTGNKQWPWNDPDEIMAAVAEDMTGKRFVELYPKRTEVAWHHIRKRVRAAGGIAEFLEERGLGPPSQNAVTEEHLRPIFETLKEQEEFEPDEFFEALDGVQRLIDKFDHQTVHEVITLPTDHRPVAVNWVSCMHLAGRYTNHSKFREKFDQVLQTPGVYWASIGDEVEGFLSGFYSREAVSNQLIPEWVQRKALSFILDMLTESGKLLCGAWAEHTGKWHENQGSGHNPYKELYTSRGVPYYDGLGQITFKVGRNEYHVAMGHNLPGSSIYNQLHPQMRAHRFRWPGVDAIVGGHKHTYASGETTSFRDEYDAGRRNSPFITYIASGTAKEGLDKYTIRNWERGIFEWPFLVMWPDEFRLTNTRYIEDVIMWRRYAEEMNYE